MNKPKGTKDIYGNTQVLKTYLEDVVFNISELYNFNKIETPIFEKEEIFIKSVGKTSDIFTKEMYLFEDKKGRKMVLRPEGTSSIIRAIVENKLFANGLPLKLSYYGPSFRYERPQKGRQRQFTQFGVEMFSNPNPYADVEVILLAKTILDTLKIKYKLVINSLGDKDTRDMYSKSLKEYFEKYKYQLTNDSINRINKNPLRILDDKIDGKKDFVLNAPKISDFYSREIKEYFNQIVSFLDAMDVEYKIDQKLVRGLDYYSDTCFEFISTSDKVGSQATLIGGGRYSNLVKQFGGPDLSGVGFGMGIERVINELNENEIVSNYKNKLEVYVLNISKDKSNLTLGIVYMLRKAGFITEWNMKPLKMQKAFEKADLCNSKIKVIAGEKELSNNSVSVKIGQEQEVVKIEDLIEYIDRKLGEHEKN